jgi:hypothetical protein
MQLSQSSSVRRAIFTGYDARLPGTCNAFANLAHIIAPEG